jgi:nitroreductase/NAD-dependent dihydropyrimidine dehydrogenase PreA subunit
MGLFTIDAEKCKRDGICVAECPMRILEMKDSALPPTPVEDAEQRCIRCGHCVAVCPYGAFSLADMKTGGCRTVQKDLALSVEHVEHFLRSRRSIRTYQDKEIEREKLGKLLDIARYAPTGSNSQQVKWIAVNSREGVRRMSGLVVDLIRHMISEKHPMAERYRKFGIVKAWEAGTDIVTRGAPGLVIAYAPKDYMMAQTDSVIALTFLDLAAPSFGLGSCWAGIFMMAASQWPPLQQALALPEGHACFGAMMLGYPKYKYQRLPLRKKAHITWMD